MLRFRRVYQCCFCKREEIEAKARQGWGKFRQFYVCPECMKQNRLLIDKAKKTKKHRLKNLLNTIGM